MTDKENFIARVIRRGRLDSNSNVIIELYRKIRLLLQPHRYNFRSSGFHQRDGLFGIRKGFALVFTNEGIKGGLVERGEIEGTIEKGLSELLFIGDS